MESLINEQKQFQRDMKQEITILKQQYVGLVDMHYKEIMEKDEEISRLKDHVEKLLAQAKVSKKELKQHLSEQEEENLRLKNLNKNLLEQIKDLKDEKLKIQNTENKVDESKTEEILRLKNHNQSLLNQIKKLKEDKKALKDKLEQVTQEEVLKSAVTTIQVENKGTNTDSVNMTTQEDKSVEETTCLGVAVQTMDIPSECSITKSTTFSPKENLKTLYRHSNHESRQINQATYQDHSNQRRQINVSENNDVTSIQSHADKSLQNSSDQNTIQKINLGWSDPSSVRQFCLSLRRSYQLVSTKIIVPREKDFQSRKRDQAFFHRQALRTKLFEDKAF